MRWILMRAAGRVLRIEARGHRADGGSPTEARSRTTERRLARPEGLGTARDERVASRGASQERTGAASSRSEVARPEGLEPPAYRFEACRSIQLSYGRVRIILPLLRARHQRLDIARRARCAGRHHLRLATRNLHVVFDADADAVVAIEGRAHRLLLGRRELLEHLAGKDIV